MKKEYFVDYYDTDKGLWHWGDTAFNKTDALGTANNILKLGHDARIRIGRGGGR